MMVEPPITKGCGIRLKDVYNSYFILNLSLEKAVRQKWKQCASFNVKLSDNIPPNIL